MSSRHVRFPIDQARSILADGIPFGPRVHPCVCGAGRHAHAGDKATGACRSTGCRKYRPDMGWQLAYDAADAQATSLGAALRAFDNTERAKHYTENPRKPGEWSIGASDAGTCPRRIWYRNTPPEDYSPAITDGREARAGTMLHDEITRRMQALYPWQQFNVRVQIEGLDRESEIDRYDPVTGEVEDFKTAGEWKWDRLGDFGPDEDTWEQVLLYALAMEERGEHVTNIRLSYYKRSQGHDETFERPWDDVARKQANAARERLLGYATVLDMGQELPRFDDSHPDHPLCKRCEARIHCWSIPAAEALDRSPYSFTYLGPNPGDEPIIWAIEQTVEARDSRLAAEKAEKAAKDLLTGIEPGRYGAYEGYTSGGANPPDWKRYAATLAEFYALPDDQRPPLDKIEPPTSTPYRYIKWGRVRKATLAAEAKAARAAQRATDDPGSAA